MKHLRAFLVLLMFVGIAGLMRGSVNESNNTPGVIKTITIEERQMWYDSQNGGWTCNNTGYWDVSLSYGESYSIQDYTEPWQTEEYLYSVVSVSESPVSGGEVWAAFDEPQGWTYGSWSPDCSGTPASQPLQQSRTNSQWHYYGERSSLGNVRNTGWYQESTTEYQWVIGCEEPPPSSWSSFEEEITGWHEVSSSPSCSSYWDDETFTQSYTEQRTVRKGERDQYGDERSVTVDTESWTGSRTEWGCRSRVWQSFSEAVTDWHETSSSPDAASLPAGTSFSQSYTEERTIRTGERSTDGSERNVSTHTESRTGSRQATGTNHAPSSWISGSTDLIVGVTGTWNFGAIDVDGNLYRWRFYSPTNPDPQWTYASGGSASAPPYLTAFSEVGTYTWIVEVEDTAGASYTSTLQVHVSTANHAPTVHLEFDPSPPVVLTNASLNITVIAHDEDADLSAMGVRWFEHNQRQWWDLSGQTAQSASRTYTDSIDVTASTQYFRGEVWDRAPNGTAGDWQAIVVLGSWVPSLAVTPVSPAVSGNISVTYSQAPTAETRIQICDATTPTTPIATSDPVGDARDGTFTFALGPSNYTVGHQYIARMLPYANTMPIATSNLFTVAADAPVFTVTVYGAGFNEPPTPTVVHTGKHTGDQIPLVAAPAAGQTFDRWSMANVRKPDGTWFAGNGTINNATSQTGATFTVGTTDGAAQAIYQAPPPAYLVTVDGGYAVPAGPQPVGTVLVLHPSPPANHGFSGWTSSGPGTLNVNVVPAQFTVGAGAATVTASFTELFAPVITQQPLNRNALPTSTITFSVTADGTAPLSYQWQRRPNGGSTFSNLSDGGTYAGSTTATLTVSAIASPMSGDQFQCVVTGIGSVASNPATLNLWSPDVDTDGDGVNNALEIELGLNPNDPVDVSVRIFTYDKINQLERGPGGEYVKDEEGNIKEVQP